MRHGPKSTRIIVKKTGCDRLVESEMPSVWKCGVWGSGTKFAIRDESRDRDRVQGIPVQKTGLTLDNEKEIRRNERKKDKKEREKKNKHTVVVPSSSSVRPSLDTLTLMRMGQRTEGGLRI